VGEFELFRIVDCARRSLERRGDSRPRRSTPPDLFRGSETLCSSATAAAPKALAGARAAPLRGTPLRKTLSMTTVNASCGEPACVPSACVQ
jgi:hypothetical protein